MNSFSELMSSFKSEFLKSVSNYLPDNENAKSLWIEIEKAYSQQSRFYHNLEHLQNLLEKLLTFKNQFSDWDVIIFAIAYHDFVYDVLKSDNEEKSAALAGVCLKKIGLPVNATLLCQEFILATKKHLPSIYEINLFTDADLSVLGSDVEVYKCYMENIRKEYSVFPSLIYDAGRKKVVKHFLKMERIFKTDEFFKEFEDRARANLNLEYELLESGKS